MKQAMPTRIALFTELVRTVVQRRIFDEGNVALCYLASGTLLVGRVHACCIVR